MDEEAVQITAQVVAAFERLGIPYLVGGSVASSLHGAPRSTNDVDLVADLRPEHIEPLVSALGEGFYVEPTMMAEALARDGSFNLIHYDTAIKIDVFVCGESRFRKAQLERASSQELLGHSLIVSSPEDIILAKLQWYRDGGEVSERQWRDVIEVLVIQEGRLDQEYMERTARELALGDLLYRALAQARS